MRKQKKQYLESLKTTRTGETTIITSHRLSAIQHAHKIIVMHEGTIVESGSHEELMKLDGQYKEMYELQQLEALVEQGRRGIMSDRKTAKTNSKDQWVVLRRLLRIFDPT